MEKSYYQQLEEDFKVLDFIQCFKTDFTDHDKKVLESYEGDFILQIRATGSNLLTLRKEEKLDEIYSQDPSELNEVEKIIEYKSEFERRKSWKSVYEVWIKQLPVKREEGELKFFYGTNGKIKEVTSIEELDKIWQKYNIGKLYA